ncbi:MAG: Hpt domain-containing protein [Treponema sp.]|jgi:HPt (histidine-containing phosphotransfer) domain-containing protein|nr:Hpt domain-containing protein [Treponema sp.]
MALNIPGVDESIFNDLFEGDEELYISILRIFMDKAPNVLSKIAEVSEEKLADYANIIHGLKGTCANICAEDARKAALKLETMSRNGDLQGVLADNGPFIKYMEELMGNLQNWLKNR